MLMRIDHARQCIRTSSAWINFLCSSYRVTFYHQALTSLFLRRSSITGAVISSWRHETPLIGDIFSLRPVDLNARAGNAVFWRRGHAFVLLRHSRGAVMIRNFARLVGVASGLSHLRASCRFEACCTALDPVIN